MVEVIYIKKKYPEIRNIINIIKDTQIIYKEKNVTRTFKYLMIRIIYKLFNINNWNIDGIYIDKSKKNKGNSIIHTFNTICVTKNHWCVTFESIVPRIGLTVDRIWEKGEILDKVSKRRVQKFCNYMLNDNCKKIIAISHSAYNLQKEMLDILEIQGKEKLMKKTIVLYPPQKLLSTNKEIIEKNRNIDKIRFIFIANGFFLKAGKEIIDALIELKKIYNFHLTIVSNFSYVDGYETKELLKRYEKKISSLSWIESYKNISNKEVIDLCRKAHVGLLPSYQETFGYSVLEMQASGVPVITTNIRAFPEINNIDCGWIINLHLDKYGETKNLSKKLKEDNKRIVYTNLIKYIQEIFKDKSIISKKANASLKRIKKNHSVEKYSENLKKIYEENV